MAACEPISINGNTIDPDAPAVKALGLGTDDTEDSNYILVQIAKDETLTKAHKEALAGAKVDIKERVGDRTYLCRYEPKKLKPVRDLKFVKWAAVYSTQFVVSPKLRTASAGPGPGSMAVLATHPHTVDVIYHQGSTKEGEALKKEIARAAHVDPSELSDADDKIRLVVQERYLDAVARIDEVQSIVEVRANKLFNNIARNILMGKGGVADLNDIVIGSITFRGQDQIVAVADTGVDSDHPAFAGPGRIKAKFALGRPRLTNDPEGHGTHVCGSVLGNAEDHNGDIIQGAAPEAKLVMQSVGDFNGGLGGIPRNLGTLFQQAYDEGAKVHSNSWGDVMPAQPYEQNAKEIDQFVASHPDFVICFAAGNDGIDANQDGASDLRQIGSQAAAKNCITVGASENNRPDLSLEFGAFGFDASPIKFDPMANNPDGMAAFSSRGPTQERRVKPDIVAPGTGILSALSRDATDRKVFGDPHDEQWMYEAGTSMATPLVSGCAAVVRQALQTNPPPDAPTPYEPSAALVKAILINGAVELKGQYRPSEAGPSPNFSSGWGRVNLTDSVGTAMSSNYLDGDTLDDEEFQDTTIPIKSEGSTLKVTLVWTDPAGAALQNDLDLAVTLGNQTQRGNAGLNRVNNVEQVLWSNVPKGTAKVHVSVRTLTIGKQAFGLAWSVSA